MSDLNGQREEDQHDWVRGETEQDYEPLHRSTLWTCKNCDISFRHFYHLQPDIHWVMKAVYIDYHCNGYENKKKPTIESCASCARCGKKEVELRTLEMSCGYDMSELELPFYTGDNTLPVYLLDVCKHCRSDWLHFIKMWFHIKLPINTEEGSGIFIRDFGATREISEERFREMHPGVEPVRVKHE